jgi:hypothetical protein
MLEDSHTLPENTVETLELCKVNISFMSMAINRTVDFTKSASKIALQPKKETVAVSTAIQWAINCVRSSMHDGILIRVDPIPSDISDFLVTDKHWYCCDKHDDEFVLIYCFIYLFTLCFKYF